MTEPKWTACYECDRGGRGNAKDKCACGWKVTADNGLGCFLGTPIVGSPVNPPKSSRAKERYKKYLEVSDCFESFLHFLKYESAIKAGAN